MTIKEAEQYSIFLALSGSRLYGINNEDSDYDYRGVMIAPLEYYFSNKRVDQVIDPQTTIFELRRFFHLASMNNPNIIELLWVPEKYWKHNNSIWRIIVENRQLFMSKKTRYTYSGYAYAQLQRIKQHKYWLMNPLKTMPKREDFGLKGHRDLSSEAIRALLHIDDEYVKDEYVEIAKAEKRYVQAMKDWQKYQEWKTNRNPDRAKIEENFGYDCKHATHLVRLFRQGMEILQTGEIIVDRRGVDADELKSIRNGVWSYDKIVEYCEDCDKKIQDLYEQSLLPYSPDLKKIDKLLFSILLNHLCD